MIGGGDCLWREAADWTAHRSYVCGESVLTSDYPPEVHTAWRAAADRALKGEAFKLEIVWTGIDQRQRIFENNFSPLCTPSRSAPREGWRGERTEVGDTCADCYPRSIATSRRARSRSSAMRPAIHARTAPTSSSTILRRKGRFWFTLESEPAIQPKGAVSRMTPT